MASTNSSALAATFATAADARRVLAENGYYIAHTPPECPTPKWTRLEDTDDCRAVAQQGESEWVIVEFPDPSRFDEIRAIQERAMLYEAEILV